ncbi:exonuclease domain-containing protein [Actinomycetaceae bacterium MB13-C1-2]|nr:exonuclease domain-containing protein [Actinomycetaceae bacterium MB13-C1-2]
MSESTTNRVVSGPEGVWPRAGRTDSTDPATVTLAVDQPEMDHPEAARPGSDKKAVCHPMLDYPDTAQAGTAGMAQWVSDPWLGFDTETTGVSPTCDRIVTAATVTRFSTGVTETKSWLINPQVPIPARATAVHGISTEYASSNGQDPREGLDQISEVLANHMSQGRIIVVFNAGFDLPLLEADSKRHGVKSLSERLDGEVAPVADPLVLDRALDRYRKGKRTLADVALAYGIAVPEDTHQAHVDSILALEVLGAILDRYPSLGAMSLSELHQYQRDSHSRWAEDFQKFLASKGKTSQISRVWF